MTGDISLEDGTPFSGSTETKKSLQTKSYVNKKRYNLKHEQTGFNNGRSSFITHVNSWYMDQRFSFFLLIKPEGMPPWNYHIEFAPAVQHSFSLSLYKADSSLK